jgi:hypothetical protein
MACVRGVTCLEDSAPPLFMPSHRLLTVLPHPDGGRQVGPLRGTRAPIAPPFLRAPIVAQNHVPGRSRGMSSSAIALRSGGHRRASARRDARRTHDQSTERTGGHAGPPLGRLDRVPRPQRQRTPAPVPPGDTREPWGWPDPIAIHGVSAASMGLPNHSSQEGCHIYRGRSDTPLVLGRRHVSIGSGALGDSGLPHTTLLWGVTQDRG